MSNDKLTRRTLIAAGAAGALGLASLTGTARAATVATPTEKANLKLMKDFIVAWTKPDFDPDKVLKQYVADDIVVRFSEDGPALNGREALAAPWRTFVANGQKGVVKLVDIYAQGPLVMAHRTETVVTPGKPDETQEMVGVFFIKNGKIKSWSDYIIS